MLEDEIASAPPRKVASASSTMFAVAGVSFTQTGTVATAFTACVEVEQSTGSLPTLAPMSTRSMCGHEKLSSMASTPSVLDGLREHLPVARAPGRCRSPP